MQGALYNQHLFLQTSFKIIISGPHSQIEKTINLEIIFVLAQLTEWKRISLALLIKNHSSEGVSGQ